MALQSGRRRLDIGRLIMVPAFAGILVADSFALGNRTQGGATGVLQTLGAVLVVTFYALVIWCYLRRGPALATSGSATAHAAAIAATWLPFAFPLIDGAPAGQVRQALADVLLICGMAWAVWSLRFLGRNVSILAQARGVAEQGPYRWVRHPLYSGEIMSSLGLAIAVNSYTAFGLWLALCALQIYRALREEQVLLRALPAYGCYRSRTAALLPGVF